MFDYNDGTVDRSVTSISNQIAIDAILAASSQIATHSKPGTIHRYHDFPNTKFEHYLTGAITLHNPIHQIASRGAMVDRGLIDFDEVDMGWIISEAVMNSSSKHRGGLTNLGMLFMFAPIAAAAGYVISKDQLSESDQIEITKIPKIALEFVENTTPEDTVNIVNMLYKLKSEMYSVTNYFGLPLPETILDLLEEEINLLDFFKSLASKNFLFEEISKGYPISFKEGLSAFTEAINEQKGFIDAISHTYITILSLNPDSLVFQNFDRQTAIKIQQDAKSIVESGGYLTSKGRELTFELDKTLNKTDPQIHPATTADITATVSFLGTLLGVKP